MPDWQDTDNGKQDKKSIIAYAEDNSAHTVFFDHSAVIFHFKTGFAHNTPLSSE